MTDTPPLAPPRPARDADRRRRILRGRLLRRRARLAAKPRSMAGQLLLAVAAGSTLAFLATITIIAATDAERVAVQRQEELDTLANSLSQLLAPRLWNLERARAESDLSAIANRSEILGIRVLDENGRVFAEAGDPTGAAETLSRTAPIRFRDDYVDRQIGALQLAVRAEGFWSAFTERLTTLAPTFAAVLLIAGALIFRQVHRALRRPIDLLTAAMAKAGAGGAPPRVEERFGVEMQQLVNGFNRLSHDISKAQNQLTRRLGELEKANETKSRFLAMMSHELRTPLNAIIGFSELIEAELHGPIGAAAYKDYAGDIRSAGNHLLLLINEILDLNRIESGREILDETPIDVAELIRDIASLAQFKAETAGVLVAHDDVTPSLTLIGDARRIRQVLLNLLHNAIKASPEGAVCRLCVERCADGGLILSVIDQGEGFDAPEDLAEPFKTGGESYQRDGQTGLGLGLAISARLARRHGGDLTIDSTPGQGATARFRMPPEKVFEQPPEPLVANG